MKTDSPKGHSLSKLYLGFIILLSGCTTAYTQDEPVAYTPPAQDSLGLFNEDEEDDYQSPAAQLALIELPADTEEAHILLTNTIKGEDSKSYKITGETSDNCSRIIVKAYDSFHNNYDIYTLDSYQYGDTEFFYGIREDWNNLKIGYNTYFFTAYCDNNQQKEAKAQIDYQKPFETRTIDFDYKPVNLNGFQTKPPTTFTIPPSGYSSNGGSSSNGSSDDDYYINSDGEKVQSPTFSNTKPSGSTATCSDGSYSFSKNKRGTCSGHGGVAN